MDRKIDDTFLMGTTSSINVQSLGKDRTTRAGCRCENVVFVLFLFFVCLLVTLRVRYLLTCRAFEGCIVRTRIALPFIGRFRRGLDRFFGMDCTFRHATQFSHSSLVGATIFAKLRSKIAISPKIGGKVCAHHFVSVA